MDAHGVILAIFSERHSPKLDGSKLRGHSQRLLSWDELLPELRRQIRQSNRWIISVMVRRLRAEQAVRVYNAVQTSDEI